MQTLTRQSNSDYWIDQVFAAKSVKRGSVIRRSIKWVHREIGDVRFQSEVKKRGFHLLRTADQYIVVCHHGPIHMLF